MIYAVLGALVVGLSLGIFGSGGSILTVPVLIYLLQHADKVAIAESLGIVGAIALIGAVPYAYDRLVSWRTALLFGAPGMAGTFTGAWIGGFVPGHVQLIVFGAVMGVAAVSMWRRGGGSADSVQESETSHGWAAAHLAAQGFGVGALTGFVGVGGGFLIVPALVLVARLPMRRAVATSLVVIAMNAGVGLLKYHHALTDAGASPAWDVMAVFVVIGALGTFVGRGVQSRINQRALQRGFGVFLIVMAGLVLARETYGMYRAMSESPTMSVEGVDQ